MTRADLLQRLEMIKGQLEELELAIEQKSKGESESMYAVISENQSTITRKMESLESNYRSERRKMDFHRMEQKPARLVLARL